MKLSMRMIANRLYNMDMEVYISEEDPVRLKSARRAYATDCVSVCASGKDTLCRADSGTILLKDTMVSQGFEIIQDVFDFYEDWYYEMQNLMSKGNYQEAIDHCWQIFQNPMILMDTDCRVLGMTACYDENPPDEEWAYLRKNGYASVQALQYVRKSFPDKNFAEDHIQSFEFKGKKIDGNGVACGLYRKNELIGRLTLLETERKINEGDHQMIGIFINCFLESLNLGEAEGLDVCKSAVYYQLLNGENVDENAIKHQLRYKDWDMEDLYQIILVKPVKEPLMERVMNLIEVTLRETFPKSSVLRKDREFVLIWNVSHEGEISQERLESFRKESDSIISKSLYLSDISKIFYLYIQAKSAVEMTLGKNMGKCGSQIIDFYDRAMDYIILSGNMEKIYYACHPDIMHLWEREKVQKDGLFDTFEAYLNHDCSIKNTAEAVFIHRNTLMYRIQKILKMFKTDINDSYTKNYMHLSIQVLRLAEKI